MENKTVWKKYSSKQNSALEDFSEKYIDFISECKTERECTDYLVSILEDNGFIELSRLMNSSAPLRAGDKVYSVNKNKGILAFHIGKEDLEHPLLRRNQEIPVGNHSPCNSRRSGKEGLNDYDY